MSSKELDKFLSRSHKELSIQDFEGKGVPCIEFDGRKFDDILSKVAGKPLVVDTNLNIPVSYTHLTLPTILLV